MRTLITVSLLLAATTLGVAQTRSPVIVQAPLANEVIGKVDEVRGVCAVKGAVPVVFVKGLADTDWWVQAPATIDGAKFKCNAHFGETDTKKDTRFKLVVVAVPASKVKDYPEGKSISNLPSFPASDPIIVTR